MIRLVQGRYLLGQWVRLTGEYTRAAVISARWIQGEIHYALSGFEISEWFPESMICMVIQSPALFWLALRSLLSSSLFVIRTCDIFFPTPLCYRRS